MVPGWVYSPYNATLPEILVLQVQQLPWITNKGLELYCTSGFTVLYNRKVLSMLFAILTEVFISEGCSIRESELICNAWAMDLPSLHTLAHAHTGLWRNLIWKTTWYCIAAKINYLSNTDFSCLKENKTSVTLVRGRFRLPNRNISTIFFLYK